MNVGLNKKRRVIRTKEKILVELPDGSDKCVAVGSNDTIYVSAYDRRYVNVVRTDGTYIRKRELHLSIDNVKSLKVMIWDATDPHILTALSNVHAIRMFPPGIAAVCASYCGMECLAIVESEKHCVKVFSLDGHLICTLGGVKGNKAGEFMLPRNCAMAPTNGYIYVTDTSNNRIQVLNVQGECVLSWGDMGHGASQFVYPMDLIIVEECVDVADLGNHRIQCFSLGGIYIREWSTGSDSFPRHVAVGPNGNIYVSDIHREVIREFCSHGLLQNCIDVRLPSSLCFGSDRMYVISDDWSLIEILCGVRLNDCTICNPRTTPASS